jgi:hypothetical protein
MNTPHKDIELREAILNIVHGVGYGPGGDRESAPVVTDEQAVAKIMNLITTHTERALSIERGFHIKGIEDYRKFKGSDDEFERTAAWINQLSPWNLDRGVEHLKWRFEIKPIQKGTNHV